MFFYLKLISPTRSCGLFANGNREMGGELDKKKWRDGSCDSTVTPPALQEKINS